MRFKTWLEGYRGNLARLQPNTVVPVFHGTDHHSAYLFCINGIDARTRVGRIYPHFSGGKPLKFGVFVGPDVKTAFKFGHVVIKFKTLGKNLIYKFPAEMSRDTSYPWITKRYPKSFRPTVSDDMLGKGVEPQALFIGLLSPRAIEKVWVWQNGTGAIPMTREQFIEEMDKRNERWRWDKSPIEPQQYRMSLDDFVKRIADHENATPQEIMDTLERVYKRHGYLTGIGDYPPTLLKWIEKQLRSRFRT